MPPSASLIIDTDWATSNLGDKVTRGIGYYTITQGTAVDNSDFIVGGTLGYGIAPDNLDLAAFAKEYSITRGRSNELDRMQIGTAILTLDSPCLLFSPADSQSGGLAGSILPGRSITISWVYSGSRFYRFSGRLKAITPQPNIHGGRDVVFELVDRINELQRFETRSTLYQNVLSGSLTGSLLNNAGFFTTCRVMADGQDTYDYAYFERRKLDEVLADIERTEYGFMFVRGDGAFVFNDRSYRQTTLTPVASVASLDSISLRRSDDDLATIVETTFTPKVQKAETTVWTLQSPVGISAGSAASFFGSYIDATTCQLSPALGVASPIIAAATAPAACFYSTSLGTGNATHTDISASFTAFAESFKFVASNSGSSTNWLTKMTVTGSPLVSYEQQTARALDTTSCEIYGERVLSYTGQNLIHTSVRAQNLAQFILDRVKDPAILDDIIIGVNEKSDATYQQILRRELNDLIAVTNDETGLLDAPFFIGRIDETWSVNAPHRVSWELEYGSGSTFLVDSSIIGGNHTLGY